MVNLPRVSMAPLPQIIDNNKILDPFLQGHGDSRLREGVRSANYQLWRLAWKHWERLDVLHSTRQEQAINDSAQN